MLLDGANTFFRIVNPSSSVTEQLTNEKNDINHLLQYAAGLQAGSHPRARIINDLKAKYPGQFDQISGLADNKLIDATKARINQSYTSRIAINEQQLELKKKKDEDAVYMELADRLDIQASIMSRKDHTPSEVKKWIKADDGALVRKSGIPVHFIKTPQGLRAETANLQELHLKRQEEIKSQEAYIKNLQFWADVDELKGNTELQKKIWGDDYAKNKAHFDNTLNKTTGWQQLLTGKLPNYNYNELDKLVHPAYSIPEGSNGNKIIAGDGQFVSQRSPDSGKNAIVINVNSPLIGKQEYRVGSMQQANEISLRQQEEQLLKILRAAASSAY